MYFSKKDRKILKNIIKSRRDVRGNRFLDTKIDKKILYDILQNATLAPSVGFSQPWKFVIIDKKKTKNKIFKVFQKANKKASKLFTKKYNSLKLEGIKEAPINIAVYCKKQTKNILGATTQPNMLEYSVVCAIQNLWLMARAYNIGVGWVSILNQKKVNKILDQDDKLIAYLCIGYVDKFYKKPELELNKWAKRKKLKNVVSKI